MFDNYKFATNIVFTIVDPTIVPQASMEDHELAQKYNIDFAEIAADIAAQAAIVVVRVETAMFGRKSRYTTTVTPLV